MSTKCEAVVIGGGISGLATAKCFQDAGIEVKLLERTSGVGGLWNYRLEEYGVMNCTYINVSKQNYCFSDFPFPDDTPDFPHHTVMQSYIQSYVDHFKLSDVIKFNTEVTSLKKIGDEWRVECMEKSEDGDNREMVYECKFVAVATGHHAKPKIPKFKGEENFRGTIIHSVKYKSPQHNHVGDKRVLVIGIGNSAVDVAVDNVRAGTKQKVYISTRSGAWVLNNYVFDRPIDHYACRLFLKLPWKIASSILETVTKLTFGDPFRYNINPVMRAMQTQPTVSPTMYYHLRRGNIQVKPNIERFTPTGVVFTDGESLDVDFVVKCIGYHIDLPFMEEDTRRLFLNKETNVIKLYKNVFCPTLGPSIGFIGFVQPASGGIISMAETQARWMAELCRNHCFLPPKFAMFEDIRKKMKDKEERYFHSSRHTIQEDPIVYNDDVAGMFGAKPSLWKHPLLIWHLLLSSGGCAQYRLEGPGAWRGAAKTVRSVGVTPLLHYSTLFCIIVVLVAVIYIYCAIF